MFIVQIGIFLYIMSHKDFIQNSLPGSDPEGWFLFQILWSSEFCWEKELPSVCL